MGQFDREISGLRFTTKKELTEFCQSEIKHLYKGTLTVPNSFWINLVLGSEHVFHYRLKEDILSGKVIRIGAEQDRGGLTTVAIYKDGSKDYFSWRKCITPEKPIDSLDLMFRHSVWQPLKDFKNNYFKYNPNSTCPYTKQPITKENSHVDHKDPTFNQLRDGFLKDVSLFDCLDLLEIVPIGDRGLRGIKPPYSWVVPRFTDYHNRKTDVFNLCSEHLQVISAKANLKKGNKTASEFKFI